MQNDEYQIFYIHGFNSYKGSTTPKKLHQVLGLKIEELCYYSHWCFDDIMADLKRQFSMLYRGQKAIMIGTSMGGFFADQLADLPGIHALVLINPVVDPVHVLSNKTFLGPQENFITHEIHSFTLEIAATYQTRRDMRSVPVLRRLLLSAHDELLDASVALEWWQSVARVINIEGGHRLTDYGSVCRVVAGLIPESEDINERYSG